MPQIEGTVYEYCDPAIFLENFVFGYHKKTRERQCVHKPWVRAKGKRRRCDNRYIADYTKNSKGEKKSLKRLSAGMTATLFGNPTNAGIVHSASTLCVPSTFKFVPGNETTFSCTCKWQLVRQRICAHGRTVIEAANLDYNMFA